jgi:hypothetical protein
LDYWHRVSAGPVRQALEAGDAFSIFTDRVCFAVSGNWIGWLQVVLVAVFFECRVVLRRLA